MSRLSNRTIILGFAILAVISLTFGILNFHKALPEIGIDFKVSRAEALQNAREFMASRRYEIAGFKERIRFSYAGDSKIYLERELGVERLTSLAEDSLDVWRWTVRFFKPLQKLEYRVMLDPKGRPVAFRRDIPESLPGPTLDTLAAQTLGEAFIAGPMAQSLDKWRLIETGVQDLPARRDYTFTYELKDFKAKEATYRLEAIVQGAEVGGFRRFLREPEDWWRGWEKQRSQNELFQTFAEVAALLIAIGMLIYFFKNVKQGQVNWRLALGLGFALAAAKLIMNLNSIPLAMGTYQTTQSFGSFLTVAIFKSITGALGLGMLLTFMVGAGEWLYRQDFPNKLSLAAFFTRRGMKSQEFFQATVMGYLLCAFDVGLVVAIYMLGSKVGFWSPADIKYDETVSTWLPWIAPLAISLGASLLEEFMFRMFGISLFKRLTKSTALAVIIPAFIWGFLHSSYPQQPGFARGIEVGIVGVIAGVVMLRFGIWATLVYHYLFDAVMIGLFLFRSDDLYFWVSGLIVCGFLLAPAVIAGIIYLRKRKFEEVEDLLNRNVLRPVDEHPEPSPEIDQERHFSQVAPSKLFNSRLALTIGVIGIALSLIPGPRGFGDKFTLQVSLKQALEKAKQSVEETYQVKLDDYKVGIRSLASMEGGGVGGDRNFAMTYIKRYGTLEDAERLLLNPEGPNHYRWQVHFQKEYEPTEYFSFVPMDSGRITTIIQIADSLGGADLSADSARALAISSFEATEPEPAKFHLIDEKSTRRPNRRDWTFIWETIDPVLKDAHLRRTTSVKGNLVTTGQRWVKLPEEWERSEKEESLGMTLLVAFVSISMMWLAWLVVANFGKAVKKGEVVWKEGILPAVVVLFISLLAAWNDRPSFWFDYESSKPIVAFLIIETLKTLVAALVLAGATLVAVVLAQALASGIAGKRVSLSQSDQSPESLQDDLFAALGVSGVILGIGWLLQGLTGWMNLPVHTWAAILPGQIGSRLPLVSGLTDGVQGALIGGSALFVLMAVVKGWANRNWKIALLLVLCGLAGLVGADASQGNLTNGEMVWSFLQTLITCTAVYVAFQMWIGHRLQAAALAMLLISFIKTGGSLVALGGSISWQGGVLLGLAIVIATWLAMKARRGTV